jgi:hypothetical protein
MILGLLALLSNKILTKRSKSTTGAFKNTEQHAISVYNFFIIELKSRFRKFFPGVEKLLPILKHG